MWGGFNLFLILENASPFIKQEGSLRFPGPDLPWYRLCRFIKFNNFITGKIQVTTYTITEIPLDIIVSQYKFKPRLSTIPKFSSGRESPVN